MLALVCKTCNGNFTKMVKDENGLFVRNEHCKDCDMGLVDAPDDMKVFVNAYKVTREYGGPEEGDWYYNKYECLEVVPCKNKVSDDIAENLEEEYKHLEHGDISSVLGGTKIVVLVEEKMKESETRETPIYQ